MQLRIPQNSRTRLAIKNIGASILIKGASILVSFVMVPITLGYLNSYEYGIWLTIYSVLTWIYLFDIGLGNGLKNKLTEAIAKNDLNLCRVYISTTLFYLALIGIGFYILFLIAQIFLDWHRILNVDPEIVPNLNSIVTVVFAFVAANFILRTFGIIFIAKQYPAANELIGFVANLICLIIIYALTQTTSPSLAWVAYTLSGVPVVMYILAVPVIFKIFPELRPGIKYINHKYWKSLMSLGLKFFFIQIAVVVVFMTSNIIISDLFGPEQVTPYDLAFKFFSVATVGFNIILTPFWAAVTDAMTRNDYDWIKNTMKRLIGIWILISLGVCLMVIISPLVYDIWLGNEVTIPFSLSLWCGIYVIINTASGLFSNIINGFGKLHLQLIFSAVQAVIFIPLAIWFGHLFGVKGVLIALCITVAIGLVWSPAQSIKLINRTARGLWNK